MFKWICGGIAVALILIIVLTFVVKTRGDTVVGKDIAEEEITEFYYTESSSTDPPHFQRYRFYVEDGAWNFYHEKREGNTWPLTEDSVTVSGTVKLSDGETMEFFEYLNGGKVANRTENTESGGSGPWLYLYWKNDKGKNQEFTFESQQKQAAFEEFCKALAKKQ